MKIHVPSAAVVFNPDALAAAENIQAGGGKGLMEEDGLITGQDLTGPGSNVSFAPSPAARGLIQVSFRSKAVEMGNGFGHNLKRFSEGSSFSDLPEKSNLKGLDH
jgi:hypothetical protein